jgi:16S rRNA (guanine966-N2)-methyltransferase
VRIVGGRLGGRRFDAPEGEGTRPTSERVREALSSALASRGLITDARVLDLFAGTGALGFEAISRGAASLVSVEHDPRVVRMLREATKKLGIEACTEIVSADAFSTRLVRALAGKQFDLVFVDPPYKLAERVPALLDALADAGILGHDTVVVFEHDAKSPAIDPVRFATIARYEYGSTTVRLLGAEGASET